VWQLRDQDYHRRLRKASVPHYLMAGASDRFLLRRHDVVVAGLRPTLLPLADAQPLHEGPQRVRA
jgi:hypothetical protein